MNAEFVANCGLNDFALTGESESPVLLGAPHRDTDRTEIGPNDNKQLWKMMDLLNVRIEEDIKSV